MNIRMARLKRRISVKDFAERIGASQSTVARLEKGDSGVSIGTLSMACLVLGEIDHISDLLDPGSDDIGLLLDREQLPKRIDNRRAKRQSSDEQDQTPPSSDVDDESGVGF